MPAAPRTAVRTRRPNTPSRCPPTSWLVGNNTSNTDINGGGGNDILVGDRGGSVTAVEPGKNYNISLIVDVSGSMSDKIGNTNVSRIALLKSSLVSLANQLSNHDGVVNVRLIPFSDKALDGFTINNLSKSNVQKLLDAIDALKANGNTNYEDAFNKAVSWFNSQVSGGKDAEHNYQNLTFFLTDGEPNRVGDGSSASAQEVLQRSLDAAKPLVDGSGVLTGGNKVTMYGIGMGSGINENYLRFFDNTDVTGQGSVAFNKSSGCNSWTEYVTGTVGEPQIVNNANELNAALQGATPRPIRLRWRATRSMAAMATTSSSATPSTPIICPGAATRQARMMVKAGKRWWTS
ncbi:hypothetical protein CTI14_30060 [Methylobacterium radiotolerans]|nr:hypothetical protein CTI14_30060 [Methylobacterium radiotolerans]